MVDFGMFLRTDTENLADSLAIGSLFVYSIFVFFQTRAMRKQNLVMQESEWVPETYLEASSRHALFRGKRPWFPTFRLKVGGHRSEWLESSVRPTPNYPEIGVEWETNFPNEFLDFFEQIEPG